MNLLRGADGDVEDIVERSLGQMLRFLSFDGAVFYSSVPQLNVLWPLAHAGGLREAVPPALSGRQLVGSAFDAAVPVVAAAPTIAATGEAWLRAEGAQTALAVPLGIGTEAPGILLLFSRYAVDVDAPTLRAVTVFAAQLNSTMRRAPLFVTFHIQRHQIEAAQRIVGAAVAGNMTDERAIYQAIAREVRLLTGAHSVAFVRPARRRAFAAGRNGKPPCRSLIGPVGSLRHHLPKPGRTVLRAALPAHDLTLALLWRSSFQPTAQQRRLVDLIVSALTAVEDVRTRVAMAERERRAQYLADVSRALGVSLDLAVVLEQLESLFVPASADRIAVDLDPAQVHEDEFQPDDVPATDRARPLREAVRAAAAWTAWNGSLRQRFDPPLAGGLFEAIVVPMVSAGQVIGTIAFGRALARGSAGADDRALYEELTAYAAAAIANAASFRRTSDVADVLQHALLPTVLPEHGRLLFDAAYAPAGARAHVGGDWYDVFALDDDRFAVSIGDVGGHGTRAAVTMNVVRLAFRAAALGRSEPLQVLERGDAMLALEHEPPLVTALYGVIDLARNVFTYACAGHMPPLLVDAAGAITTLPTLGTPLGIGLCAERRSFEAALAPGDALVLYTDGLVEYGRDAMAGELRLSGLLHDLVAAGRPTTLARDLHAATFGSGATQRDDVAVLTISLR